MGCPILHTEQLVSKQRGMWMCLFLKGVVFKVRRNGELKYAYFGCTSESHAVKPLYL